MKRTNIIRRLLNRAFTKADNSPAVDLQAIDDSFGALRDLDVPVRSFNGPEEHRRGCGAAPHDRFCANVNQRSRCRAITTR